MLRVLLPNQRVRSHSEQTFPIVRSQRPNLDRSLDVRQNLLQRGKDIGDVSTIEDEWSVEDARDAWALMVKEVGGGPSS